MTLGMVVGLGPGHIVLDEDPDLRPKRGTVPIFGPCLLWPNGRPSQLLLSSCYIIICQAALQYYADEAYCYRRSSMVYRFVTIVRPAKMAELIEISLGVWTWVILRKEPRVRWGSDPHANGQF